MQNWMISANGKIYDHAAAFAEWGYIDWRQRANFNIGDQVYIYCTRPYKKVMYKTSVVKESMPFNQCTDDREYWYNLQEYEKAKFGRYVRLKLIKQVDNEELALENLKQHGLTTPPQGPIKINDELAKYIDKYIRDDDLPGFFPESDIPEESYEGFVKTVLVNKYERSSIARKRCVEYHGYSCAVCGMNFEHVYGELGKNFIHVHHIVPLNEIGKEYIVDYKKDLIPVCPNCHAMLHRALNGKCISIEELKHILSRNS